jgi:hypothetical protein
MIKKGFAIYDIIQKFYLDIDMDGIGEISEIYFYDSIDDAKEEVESMENSNGYEVHEVELCLTVINIKKRTVAWE